MAIRHDYLERLKDHGDETKYVDLVLEGWAKWVNSWRGPSQPVPAGNVMGVVSVIEGKYELRLSDDEFTLTDSKIAVLASRLRQIVELEYRGLWNNRRYLLSQEEKWRRLGLKRTEYSQRLGGAQWALHQLLLPHIEIWRERNLPKRD
jgi:hypothetical protein